VTVITQLTADGPLLLSFTYLLLIFFSLMSFRFHYLSGIIPLVPVPCGVFWGVGEGGARGSTGRGGPTRVAGASKGGASTGGEGPGGGKLDGCIMHQVHTS